MPPPDDGCRQKAIATILLGVLLTLCGAGFNLAITMGPLLSSLVNWQRPSFNMLLMPLLVIGNMSLLPGVPVLYIGIRNLFARRDL